MGSSCTQGPGLTYCTIITELVRLRNHKESGQLKGEGISLVRSEIWLLTLAVRGVNPSIMGLQAGTDPNNHLVPPCVPEEEA